MDPEEIFDRASNAGPARRSMSRRGFIGMGVAGTGMAISGPANAAISALMCPPRLGSFGGASAIGGEPPEMIGDADYSGAVPDDGPGMRHLVMTNFRTGERFDRPYVEGGSYVPDALAEFSRFARDWRVSESQSFDPKTIDIIWQIWRKLGTTEPFNLNSGYRSPKTNASLPGAATQSLHMQAKAADISMKSRSVRDIHAAAVSLKSGGVGKYTSSNFVHVDSGRVRFWGS